MNMKSRNIPFSPPDMSEEEAVNFIVNKVKEALSHETE